jgi:fumarylacetoacetase
MPGISPINRTVNRRPGLANLNQTHDPNLKSWVESANRRNCHFPVQNLPYGVFSTPASPDKRVGVAIGDRVLDLGVLEKAGLIPTTGTAFGRGDINAFMALGAEHWQRTRGALSGLLASDNVSLRKDADLRAKALIPLADATLHLPFAVAEYTDFYASREHATNVGAMFRDPENALLPNWLHMPVGYNGRASTVVVSGTDIHRPWGQIKPPGSDEPIFSASRKLDFEIEMGAIVGTPSKVGTPIAIEQADAMIFGYTILNDWSARDIQVWEYQPLGPFLSKAFATTLSPWIVTSEALEPFRIEGPAQSPNPLAYLRQTGAYNYDITLEATLRPEAAKHATHLSTTNVKYLYWSSAQQLTHHASGGCAMRTGDLLGTGTISGPGKASLGSLLEMTWNGENPISLETGGKRTFIEDGDTLTITAWCQGDGPKIGFGEATGKILPAKTGIG